MNIARIVFFAFVTFSSASTGSADGIRWFIDIDEAKQQAYSEGKLILILFQYASFDRSVKMTSEVLNQDTIIGLSRNLICVRVNLEQMELSRNIILKDKNRKLIIRYRITSVPIAVITDAAGNPLANFNDEVSIEEIITLLRSLPDDLKHLYAVLKPLEQQPDNILLNIAAGDEYQRLRIFHVSNEFYDNVKEEDTVKEHPELSEHIRSSVAVNFDAMGKVREAIQMFEELLDEQPVSRNRPFHLYMLTKLYMRVLREIQARDYYNVLKKEFPGSEYTFMAWELLKE